MFQSKSINRKWNGYSFRSFKRGPNVLRDAHVVIINGEKDEEFEERILKYNKYLNIFYSNYYSVNSSELRGKKLLAEEE